jgi:hypothetical protein
MDPFSLVAIQWFDWTSPNERCCITFPISRMLNDIAEGFLPFTPQHVALTDQGFQSVISREPDMAYVLGLSYDQCQVPVLFAKLGETYILIDGTHRYVASTIRGLDSIPAMLLAEKDWMPYVKIKGNIADAYLNADGKAE